MLQSTANTADVVESLRADEPIIVRRLRIALRQFGPKYDTEKAFASWIKRFIQGRRSTWLAALA